MPCMYAWLVHTYHSVDQPETIRNGMSLWGHKGSEGAISPAHTSPTLNYKARGEGVECKLCIVTL